MKTSGDIFIMEIEQNQLINKDNNYFQIVNISFVYLVKEEFKNHYSITFDFFPSEIDPIGVFFFFFSTFVSLSYKSLLEMFE